MEKIFEIKSFARIIPSAELLFGSFFDNNGAKSLNLMSFGGNAVSKGFKDFSLRSEGQKELFKAVSILTQNGKDKIYFSQKINLFDKIFFEEKVNSKNSGSIEIRGKGKIKFPTNANNICFFVAKEMQKFFAKKNKGTKPNGIKITIEKNIPLHSGLGGAVSNAFETMKFLNDFWKINLSEQDFEEKFFDFLEKFFGGKSFCFENFFSTRENFFSNKKIFILIPKYIFIEKDFFGKILEESLIECKKSGFSGILTDNCKGEIYLKSQKKIKTIFPDLEKFIKIFLENGAILSDISGKGGTVFGVFDENIENEKVLDIKKIFGEFGKIFMC